MPELPEVEVLRLSLRRRLPGRKVTNVRVHSAALRQPVDHQILAQATEGRRVESLSRRSKYLQILLSGGWVLVVHLGMSGRLTVVPRATPRERHEHVAFLLDGGERLRFVDPRRFGMVFALRLGDVDSHPRFANLGVEPLGPDFSGPFLRRAAAGRRGPLKSFLMDGRVVVGVGNIYASEALWRARIHPRRSVARMSQASWDRIAVRVRDVLADAIRQGGTTLNDFADSDGNAGYFQVALAAYGREGEPCQRCERPIRRIVQAGRSTFYCPGCQR